MKAGNRVQNSSILAWLSWSMMLPVWLFTPGHLWGQVAPDTVIASDLSIPPDSGLTLRGHLILTSLGWPLNRALVAHDKPFLYTESDSNGDFVLRFPPHWIADTITLHVFWRGDVHPVPVSIDPEQLSQQYTFALQMVPDESWFTMQPRNRQPASPKPSKRRRMGAR